MASMIVLTDIMSRRWLFPGWSEDEAFDVWDSVEMYARALKKRALVFVAGT